MNERTESDALREFLVTKDVTPKLKVDLTGAPAWVAALGASVLFLWLLVVCLWLLLAPSLGQRCVAVGETLGITVRHVDWVGCFQQVDGGWERIQL